MGLLDGLATSVHQAFGLFKMRDAYAGASIRVKDSLGVEEDIGFDGSGELDVAALSGNTPYKIVKWYDQSGNARDMTNTTGAGELTLSTAEDALRIDSAKFLNMTDLSALTAGEGFFYRKVDADPPAVGSGGIWDMGSAATTSHIPFTDSKVYDDFGTTVRKDTNINPAAPMTSYHIYSAYSATNDWADFIDGTSIYSTATNTVSFPAAPVLGRANGSIYMVGYARAFVLLAAKGTSGDRTILSNTANYVPSAAVPTSGTLEIDFGQSRSISEIDVFTLADAQDYDGNPSLSDTFTLYGAQDYSVEYWDGATWVEIDSVTGNDKVWRKFTFSAIATEKIRVVITDSPDGKARLVEVEAWGQ